MRTRLLAIGASPKYPQAHGFAVSATGDDYPMYEPSCSCTAKVGQKLSPLGSVDGQGAGDVAVAVDPVTGHLYADDQSSVAEWDTGAMNRNSPEVKSAGTLVARFGSPELSGTSGQGGIAVDGKTAQDLRLKPGRWQGLRLRQRRPGHDSRRTDGRDHGSGEPERHDRSARRCRQLV